MTDMCHFFMDYHFILISSGLQLKKKRVNLNPVKIKVYP